MCVYTSVCVCVCVYIYISPPPLEKGFLSQGRLGWVDGWGILLMHCDKSLQNSSVHHERFLDFGALKLLSFRQHLQRIYMGRVIIK